MVNSSYMIYIVLLNLVNMMRFLELKHLAEIRYI